jgi:hypothetical protein
VKLQTIPNPTYLVFGKTYILCFSYLYLPMTKFINYAQQDARCQWLISIILANWEAEIREDHGLTPAWAK